MSKKETQNTQQQEKFVSNYDKKMQRRREEKEKAKREQRISTIVGVAIVAALVCLVASFPIRNYLAINEIYIAIDGENITRVEFDYNYNLSRNSYLAQYGAYMSMMGLDISANMDSQMYSQTLTWKDFFEQLTVENLKSQKAIYKKALADGFVYDPGEDYAEFEQMVKDSAAEAGVSEKEYIQQLYGPYATLGRISDYVKESIVAEQYFEQVAEQNAPTEEEIQAHYDENKDDYDSVDYRLVSIDAELPTEPTELADPVEEATEENQTDSDAASLEEAPYEPSEAEIKAAMAEAKEKADEAVKTVAADGELQENVKKTGAVSLLRDWLFDSARKAGDTTVIENETAHRYYVIAFEKRYLDETPSADARVLVTNEQDGQALLDEWKAGEATEESFAELCTKYSADAFAAAEGGLFEGITKGSMSENISQWLFDEARAAGDTVSISLEEDGYTYVIYYIGTNDPEWKMNIRSTLSNETMNAYIQEITADVQVDDKGNLNYVKVEEEEAAAAAETAEDTAPSDTSENSDAVE